MKYAVLWQDEAREELLALPRKEAAALVRKVDTYLAQQPKTLGKPLSGQFSGLYRYRFGDYRVIYQLIEAELHILVVRVGHRKDVYE